MIPKKDVKVVKDLVGCREKQILGFLKTRRTILIFGILAISVVTGIFVWQLSSLPFLRLQLETGLNASLQIILLDTSEELEAEFTREFERGVEVLATRLAGEDTISYKALLPEMHRVATTYPLAGAWVVVEKKGNEWEGREYKKPSRYLKESTASGSWRSETNLSREFEKLIREEDPMVNGQLLAWQIPRAFQTDLFVAFPLDSHRVLCTLLNQWYFEKEFLPGFFQETHWQEPKEREGLDKEYLQFGLFSDQSNRLLYHSIAFGEEDFAHRQPLTSELLAGHSLAIGFRGESVAEVALSIYQRNYFIVVGLFVLLILLLLLILRGSNRLLRLSRLKTEFVANVSHEIKTPLASIRLATDTLRLGRANSPERMAPLVNILDQETERLQHLIRTLLDFSSLESGQRRYEFQQLSAEDWLADVRTFFQSKNLATFHVEEEGSSVGKVRVDPRALEQVFHIFIDNAIKYSPESPDLTLVIQPAKSKVRIGLRDRGIGIASADQASIFDQFVRVGNLDEHNVRGHGIGLSMARAIVRDHDGQIGVESRLGQGSFFYIDIPLAP